MATGPEAKQGMDRRQMLRWLRNGAIGVPVVGVAGLFSVRSVQATMCEHDLTKIGKGSPAIVQIHDPTCQLRNCFCGALEFLANSRSD